MQIDKIREKLSELATLIADGEPVLSDVRALKTAQQILATYKYLHDEQTQVAINQAIKTLGMMSGSFAIPYKFSPKPDQEPLNIDHLREKLAELTTIQSALANALPANLENCQTRYVAIDLIDKRIESVKKEIQDNV